MRGVLLGWLCLALPAAAQPPDCAAAARALWPEATAARATCVLAPWAADISAVAELTDEGDLRVGLLRASGQPVARGRIEALTLAPPWSPILRFEPLPRIAPGALGVTVSNGHFSTSGSLSSLSLHVFLRRDDVLLPALAVLRGAAHTHAAPCRPGQGRPCRQGWTRHWGMSASGPASDTSPPVLILRDGRAGQVVSRHRWAGQAYFPAVFDRTPPVPPG